VSSPRYEDWQLRRMGGETTYARGAAYAKEGRVRLLSIGPTVVRAQVTGSELYAVVLKGSNDDIWGDCDCPAHEDRGFCKHLVAVALAVNTATPEITARAAQSHDAIRMHLSGLGQAVLVDRLMALAERDSKLWAKLEVEVAIASEDDEAIHQRIADTMDEAMDIDEVVEWRGAGAVADELREVVEQIDGLVEAERGGVALRLLNRFFDAAPELQEAVDDSDGEVSGALCAARDLHLKVSLATLSDPKMLAAELFERELEDEYGVWEDTHHLYAEALGPEGVGEFRRLAEAAYSAKRSDRSRLRGILDSFAANDGDVDARIALRAADASSAWDYQQITQICLDAGREVDALAWAEEGVWKTEDRPDRRLTMLTARLLREQDQAEKAQALLWRAFDRDPCMDLYRLLLEGPVTDVTVVDRCVGALEASIVKQRRSSWSSLPDLLVEVLLDAGRIDRAWIAAGAHGCQDQTLVALAETTQTSHPEQALHAYASLVERCVGRVDQGGYREAIGHLARLARLRSMLDRSAEHAAHVEALAIRHKAKRNFIKLLRAMPAAS
jgi:uncharacterized Zn finger protein